MFAQIRLLIGHLLLHAYNVGTFSQQHLDGRLLDSEVGKWVRFYGLDDPRAFLDDLEWVVGSMRKAAFKRIQAAPSIRVASPASTQISYEMQGTVEPSERYKELRERICAL